MLTPLPPPRSRNSLESIQKKDTARRGTLHSVPHLGEQVEREVEERVEAEEPEVGVGHRELQQPLDGDEPVRGRVRVREGLDRRQHVLRSGVRRRGVAGVTAAKGRVRAERRRRSTALRDTTGDRSPTQETTRRHKVPTDGRILPSAIEELHSNPCREAAIVHQGFRTR